MLCKPLEGAMSNALSPTMVSIENGNAHNNDTFRISQVHFSFYFTQHLSTLQAGLATDSVSSLNDMHSQQDSMETDTGDGTWVDCEGGGDVVLDGEQPDRSEDEVFVNAVHDYISSP
jgi:hypothetical protein